MKKNIHNFKALKVVELSLFVILEAVFIIIILCNKTMKSSIFADRTIFTIASVMYSTMLVALGVLVYDFYKLRDLKIEAHELENLAYLDSKTGIPNRTSCSMFFDAYKTPESMNGIGCMVTEISNIKALNSEKGKAYGDTVMRDFSKIFETSAANYGFVGRNGGNEFITVIENCSESKINSYKALLERSIDEYNKSQNGPEVCIRSEYVLYDNEHTADFSELISRAYTKLRG